MSDTKKDEGFSLTTVIVVGVGSFALGVAGGWVANDMSREAETQAPTMTKQGGP
ncbi:MAG TPA: hypothetical protein VNA24_03880 [Hyalangium sp.]|nr:hypothetical protein [Hyalangium sp.]